MDSRISQLKAQIAEAEDVIARFNFTASLGNPEAFRLVHEARQRLTAAECELARRGQLGELK